MEELSIKIKIADREYPMRVTPSDEQRLRLAGKLVNDKLKKYREQFRIDDKQDLLAMVAFDCLVEMLKTESDTTVLSDLVAFKIMDLDKKIASVLS